MDTEPHKTPGQLIQALLDERGWSKRVLAIVLGLDEAAVSRVITAKRPVTAELALALGDLFEIEPDRFLGLQMSFELAQARLVARPDPGRRKRAQLFGALPIADMIKRGWLGDVDVRDVNRIEAALTSFFGVRVADEIAPIPHAAKKAESFSATTPEQTAWLCRVRQIASEMLVPPYSESGGQKAIAELSTLRVSTDAIRKVPRVLEEAGIRFVVVEALPKANIDGACFWLNESSPVIGMSMRFDRIDNFWFVLRHEVEHVLRGHGKEVAMVDVDIDRAGSDSDISAEERVANEAAAEFCVPQNKLRQFIAIKAPFFPQRDVLAFAKIVKAHPGLVVGQIQRRTGRYDLLREHQAKIRSIVSPGAAVDGWGDVYPAGI